MGLVEKLPVPRLRNIQTLTESIAGDEGYLSRYREKLKSEDPTLEESFYRASGLVFKNQGAFLGAGYIIRDMLLTAGPVPLTNSETYDCLKERSIIGIMAKGGKSVEGKIVEKKVDETLEIMKEENPDLGKYFDWMVFVNGKDHGEELEVLFGGTIMYDYLRIQAELNKRFYH